MKDHQHQRAVQLKYTFDVYNLTNTTSFDIPGNEVSQNQYYNAFPQAGTNPCPQDAPPTARKPTKASTTAPAASVS